MEQKPTLPRVNWNHSLTAWQAGDLLASEEARLLNCLQNHGTDPVGEVLFGGGCVFMTPTENSEMDHRLPGEVRQGLYTLYRGLTDQQGVWDLQAELAWIQEYTVRQQNGLRAAWKKHIRPSKEVKRR